MKSPSVGILSFQGDFSRHQAAFTKLGCRVTLVKSVKALDDVDCLVIPGGESSTIYRFIASEKMQEPIRDFGAAKPIWGSCAGMILLGREIANEDYVRPLGLIDMTTARNAYGRQFDSFVDRGEFTANGKPEKLEMIFIRAPKIIEVGREVETLGRWQDEITVVRQGNAVATSFHPELSGSTRFQKFFLSMLNRQVSRA